MIVIVGTGLSLRHVAAHIRFFSAPPSNMLDMSRPSFSSSSRALSRCFEHPGRGRRRTQDDAAERSVRPAWCLSHARWPHGCILLRCGRRPRRELHHAREHRWCFWLLVAHECTAPVAVRSTCACTFSRVRVICCTAAVCVSVLDKCFQTSGSSTLAIRRSKTNI